MPTDTYHELLTFAVALATEAAAIGVAQYGTSQARRKYDGTLVTQTDEQIDRLVSRAIRVRWPDAFILSEEQATWYDPAAPAVWVVDPVDGTTNFARGVPVWGVSIGVLVGGTPVAGVVNFPLLGEIFTATLGGGAFRNGERIRVSGVPLDDEQLIMECTRTRKRWRFDLPLKPRILGSAAYNVCKVADGTALACSEATPKIWDLAAAGLVLTEAGGVMGGHHGESLLPLPAERLDYRDRALPLLAARDAALLDELRAAIRPVPDKMTR